MYTMRLRATARYLIFLFLPCMCNALAAASCRLGKAAPSSMNGRIMQLITNLEPPIEKGTDVRIENLVDLPGPKRAESFSLVWAGKCLFVSLQDPRPWWTRRKKKEKSVKAWLQLDSIIHGIHRPRRVESPVLSLTAVPCLDVLPDGWLASSSLSYFVFVNEFEVQRSIFRNQRHKGGV